VRRNYEELSEALSALCIQLSIRSPDRQRW